MVIFSFFYAGFSVSCASAFFVSFSRSRRSSELLLAQFTSPRALGLSRACDIRLMEVSASATHDDLHLNWAMRVNTS
jgi:hypothetical protein